MSPWLSSKAKKKTEEYSVETRECSPADLLMKIESFSLLSKHKIRSFKSAEFNAGGYTWSVVINFDEVDGVSVYLSAVGAGLPANWEVNAIFTFCVHNRISDKYVCFRGMSWRFNAMTPTWGFSKLISNKKLRSGGYIVDDNCSFGAEVFVIKQKPKRINQFLSLLKRPTIGVDDVRRGWVISDFSKMDKCWKSDKFLAGNHNWQVILYPKGLEDRKGLEDSKGNYISLFVQCVEAAESFQPHQKLQARISLTLKNHLYADFSLRLDNQWFTTSKYQWGRYRFISIDKINDPKQGFLVDDRCLLQIQICVQTVCS